MRETTLGPGLRALIGVLGAAALVAGALVGAAEVSIAVRAWPYWPALLAAAFCALIAFAGALLVRAAWRGRILVRSTGRGGAVRRRP